MPSSSISQASRHLQSCKARIWIQRVVAAWTLACAIYPTSLRAQALSIEVPYGLAGSAAFREQIALNVDLWIKAHESARRTLLIDRCVALDRSFPGRPAPAMVAASTEVFRWMAGTAHADLPPEPYSGALRDALPILARHAFSEAELAEWSALRASPQGQRGLALHEVEVAIMKVTDQLVEVSSGRYWAWPLARLDLLADANGLRREVDAAFDRWEPGTAARLREISPMPGQTPPDERLLEQILRSGTTIVAYFFDQLTPNDKAAYDTVAQSVTLRRWSNVVGSLPRFAMGPAVGILRDRPVATTVPGFCDAVGLPSCRPGDEVHAAVTNYRAAFEKGMLSDVSTTVPRRIVRALPDSGCP